MKPLAAPFTKREALEALVELTSPDLNIQYWPKIRTDEAHLLVWRDGDTHSVKLTSSLDFTIFLMNRRLQAAGLVA